MPEVQQADPATRRRAFFGAAAVALAGWAALFVMQDWLRGLAGADPVAARRALEDAMIWGSWAACLPVAVLATWMWLQGLRISRAGRYPAPGVKVIRDTLVLHGDAARLRGIVLRVLAVFLGLLAAGTLIAVHLLVARLEA
ncbi:MAG: hypothetical protein FJ171_06980 [Gammaproteobacteria bacterium]|nr:hypothetical protein [Gammaproteobacteria bacterium]